MEREHQPRKLEQRVFENIILSNVIIRQPSHFSDPIVEKHLQRLTEMREIDDFHKGEVDRITGMPVEQFRTLFDKTFAHKQTR